MKRLIEIFNPKILINNSITTLQLFFIGYPSFCKTSWAALQEWKYCSKNNNNKKAEKGKIILVAIRNKTWIEWAIFAAINFRIKGYNPIIIYSSDDVKKARDKDLWSPLLFNFWRSALNIKFIEFIDIDTYPSGKSDNEQFYSKKAKEFAHTIAAYNLFLEEYEETYLVDEYNIEYRNAIDMLESYCVKVENILDKYSGVRIICPNGLIEKSVAFTIVSLKKNINIIFIEGWARRLGHMIYGFNRPVMFYDIKGWNEYIGPWDEQKENDFKKMQDFQNLRDVNDNDWFNGFIPVQRTKEGDELPNDFLQFLKKPGKTFLLGTNVVGDSATLCRGNIFKNQKEWLSHILNFFRSNPDYKLIIRIHPDEIFQRAKIKIGKSIENEVSSISNIFLFKADHDINTNTLMKYADAGLAWVSNFGVDMVLRNKPVIVAGEANYKEINIGIYADSVSDYFSKIISLAQNPIPPNQTMIENAKLYQRIVFKEMSLEATSKSYSACDYRLSKNRPKDQIKFYKILCGELDAFGREN